VQEHCDPDRWEEVESDIFAPTVRPGDRGDFVDASVVDEEMSLFAAFSRQNKELGG
jgi:hypothetical protein